MPHLDLTQEEMDRLHPSLTPPDDERLDDLANDPNDVVYQKCLELAEEIRNETSLQGRMRRPLVATLLKQQQQNKSSKQDRTSTIRLFGGGVLSAATTYTTIATGLTTATAAATATAMTIAMIVTNGDSVVAATDTRHDDGQDSDGEEKKTKNTEADEQGRRDVEQMQVLTMHVPGSNLLSPERPLTSAFIRSKS
jgi:hypothetical protein